MPLAKVKKIELIAIAKHKDKILDTLQEMEAMEISDIEEGTDFKKIKELQDTELTYANLCFTIQVLSPYATKKGLFTQKETLLSEEVKQKVSEFNFKEITGECNSVDEALNKAKNKINSLNNELDVLAPWKNLAIDISNLKGSDTTEVVIGSMATQLFKTALEAVNALSPLIVNEIVEQNPRNTFFYLIFEKKLKKDIKQILSEYKFGETEFPETKGSVKEYRERLKQERSEQEKIVKDCEHDLKKLAKNLENLELAHDLFAWQLEKLEAEKKSASTTYSFSITGWITERSIPKIEETLNKITKEWDYREIEPKEGEKPPVIIVNRNAISPFEAVSKIYGLPKASELDPTPFLATFFIIFFGLALTDAGYGIIMFIATALVLKYFKLPHGVKTLVRLLMYGGIATFIIGTIFGGWFGLTADQVPSFLTYTASSGEQMFLFQKINAVTDPLLVLILALVLGYIQIITGTIIKLVHDFRTYDKKTAILDSGTWLLMLTGIGVAIMGGVLESAVVGTLGKWWVITAAILLILTQGRDKKNIIMKLLGGVLSLYGLVGYLSDILSYSRLLALGLATSIIGLAVNIVADLVGGIPYIGWLFMIGVFIGGHLFNLLINTLGAFIHSGRLQFVEFFGKFMEGGGRDFKPFSKKTKYIFLKNNS